LFKTDVRNAVLQFPCHFCISTLLGWGFGIPDNGGMSPKPSAFERLYQPREPLFWVAVAFNLLGAVMLLALQSGQLTPLAQWLTALLALSNNALGSWAVWRLWRGDSGLRRRDDVAVGVPSGVAQHRADHEQP
jgi:hypothetical protein